uniref:Uncharacterized protein n=1 Tax=Edwardsiella tarda TaxID=636 RepID=A0A2S1PMD5_EDWTA|nr:hypothetical protein [Edwardsiella tarda]
MSISSIVKLRTTSERDAAVALEKAVKGVGSSSLETLQDVKLGVERASWYSSCFFDKYEDVCSELKTEDTRFIKSVFEIYKRRDIIADMMQMYVNEELKHIDNSKIQSLDIKLAEILAGYASGRLTKTAIANSLSILIVNSFGFRSDVLLQLNRYSLAIVTAASFYGKVQIAAQKADRLKSLSHNLYYILYQNNMEMLYFLVSDKIDKALINSAGLRGEDRFVSIMKWLTS